MYLSWLEARDFRSYQSIEFIPGEGVNVLIGDNGTGKTSVLEAIGYLATLRSFRRAPDAALVREGEAATVVRGEFQREGTTTRIEIEIPSQGRRRVLINGKRAAGRAALADAVSLVAFLPDDLDLVKRGPAYRREYIDDVTAQLWPAAAADQHEYERALRQRNALLRKEGRDADVVTLDVWDERIATLGAALISRRLTALNLIAPRVGALYRDLSDQGDRIGWAYHGGGIGEVTAADGLSDTLAEAITAARRTDMERRTTTVGPHRDEIVFDLEGRDVRTRASQGEQRSVALGLRVAAYDLLQEERHAIPVLLLDDVFSELDRERSKRLVELLPAGQVFVTTARREEVPLEGRSWRVTGTGISPEVT